MLTNVHECSIVWSYSPWVIFFFCLSKILSTKPNALYSDFSTKPRRLKVSSLKLNSLDLKLTEKLTIILSSHLVLLLQSGIASSACCTCLPRARPWKICVHGSTWQHAQNMVMGINATMWFGFSTSVGKSHFRNPSRLPESPFNIACLQIHFQRRDNSRWQDVN